MIELHANEANINIRLRAIFMGQDLCILIDGGDCPHIGAISLASSQLEKKTQTIVVPKHKEDVISQAVAEQVQKTLGNTVCCACGIHIDNISKDEIVKILEMTKHLTSSLLKQLKNS